MATVERNRPGSYYTDRSYYGHYPADKEVIVERKVDHSFAILL